MGAVVKATHEHAKAVLIRVLTESEREQITGEIDLKLIFSNGGLRRIHVMQTVYHILKDAAEQLPSAN